MRVGFNYVGGGLYRDYVLRIYKSGLKRQVLNNNMVILTVGICNKNGQLILARQFEGMTKNKVEDIYLSFPKLMRANQQHTYVQSDKYTFLYIPIDNLYLVTVSSKNSNIIEDQETIRTIYKLLCGICQEGITEESVEKHSIDIILATDDVISMGYRESVTVQEVENQLKMDSAEEKAHIALLKQQEQDAKMAAEKAGGKK